MFLNLDGIKRISIYIYSDIAFLENVFKIKNYVDYELRIGKANG